MTNLNFIMLISLLMFASCSPDSEYNSIRTYVLCTNNIDSVDETVRILNEFAASNEANFYDGSRLLHENISHMNSRDIIIGRMKNKITEILVISNGNYRISFGNIGLSEKYSISILYNSPYEDRKINFLIRNVSENWSLRRVSGVVLDEMPCR